MSSVRLPQVEGARRVGVRLGFSGGGRFCAIYSSDLGRTVATSEALMLSGGLIEAGVPLYKDARLREVSFGALEGKTPADIDSDPSLPSAADQRNRGWRVA